MDSRSQGGAALELLEAVGFQAARDGEGLVATLREETGEAAFSASVEVADADGGIPTGRTIQFSAVVQVEYQDAEQPRDRFRFVTDDARDIMALYIGFENDLLEGFGDSFRDPGDNAFVHGEILVSNPFRDADADWLIRGPADAEIVMLEAPASTYGEDYVAWRDERAEATMAARSLPKPF